MKYHISNNITSRITTVRELYDNLLYLIRQQYKISNFKCNMQIELGDF